MRITIIVQGIEQLLVKLTTATALQTLVAPMQRAQELIRAKLATYPPPPPASTYIRTGDLGRGWAIGGVEASGFGVVASVSNDVSYAPFVQGADMQAAIHQDRWMTDQMVVEQSAAAIGQDFTAAIQDALNT